jgi:hypothetical protein
MENHMLNENELHDMTPESRNSLLLGNDSVNTPRERAPSKNTNGVFYGLRIARSYATVL